MSIDELLAKANERLKKSKLRVSIERRNEALCLRATLPPKPGRSGRDSQQRVPLDRCKDTAAQHAEKQAKILFGQLLEKTSTWEEWLGDSQMLQKRSVKLCRNLRLTTGASMSGHNKQ